MTSNELSVRLSASVAILAVTFGLSVSSQAASLSLPMTGTNSNGSLTAMSPGIIPPLPPTVPHPSGSLTAKSPGIIPPLPPTVPHPSGSQTEA